MLLVTHDLREAGFLASRICVMSARPGRILDDSSVTLRAPAHGRDDLRAGFRRAEPAPARLHRRRAKRRQQEGSGLIMTDLDYHAEGLVGRADRAVLRRLGIVLPDDRHVGSGAAAPVADLRDAGAEIPAAVAAYPADAGDDHDRLCARRGARRRARRHHRRVEDRLRHRLSAAGRLLLDPESRAGADLRALVRLRHGAGGADRAVDLLLPDRRQYRHWAGDHRARTGRRAEGARRHQIRHPLECRPAPHDAVLLRLAEGRDQPTPSSARCCRRRSPPTAASAT